MAVAVAAPEKSTPRKPTLFRFEADSADEVVAFCPKCMTMETLAFTEAGMTPTRKFRQYGKRVYHACGSRQPCRLFRSF